MSAAPHTFPDHHFAPSPSPPTCINSSDHHGDDHDDDDVVVVDVEEEGRKEGRRLSNAALPGRKIMVWNRGKGNPHLLRDLERTKKTKPLLVLSCCAKLLFYYAFLVKLPNGEEKWFFCCLLFKKSVWIAKLRVIFCWKPQPTIHITVQSNGPICKLSACLSVGHLSRKKNSWSLYKKLNLNETKAPGFFC